MSARSRLALFRATVAGADRPGRFVLVGVVLYLVFLFALLAAGYGEQPGPFCELPCAPGGWR